MSLDKMKMPSLKDKIREQGEIETAVSELAEEKVKVKAKVLKGKKVIGRVGKKTNKK